MAFSKLGWAALGIAIVGGFIVQSVVNPIETTVANQRLPYDNTGSVAKGKSLYAENCASCHGSNLQGEPNWKQRTPDGLMPAPPHDETGHTWHHPDAMLFAITKQGSAAVVGQGYESNMPGFEGSLTDQQILDVLGYIKSTWPDRVIKMHNDMNDQQG
ncbi:c-type cytochrome [Shimia sagamensis]|uniref:Cytochrome c n=1 Tax=Shimia sagamensis TaxID=1566352 RepID=A0ABY1NT42_9RHOB|nr:cytochrome c [Shimia sagamensis]SMP17604.1 Cytochrome c [Shimia sagamensis]